MVKKSAAQIKRMQTRAMARGEVYIPPPASAEDDKNRRMKAVATKLAEMLAKIDADKEMNAKDRRSSKRKAEAIASEEAGCTLSEIHAWSEKQLEAEKTSSSAKKKKTKGGDESDDKKSETAKKLYKTLADIDANEETNAKDRRSAKRKAEAIATEESGCSPSELLELYSKVKDGDDAEKPSKKMKKANVNPYVVFVGQLAYTTTKEMLFQHFQKELGNKAVTSDTLDIRLLTDPKTKKSRGMAFVETKDPELLYECLKLHHTHIDGRRINVERSAGGKKSSEARQSKIKEYRKEQTEYMSKTVDTILEDYKKSGDLNEDELDDGVIALCKRHSAATVTNALSEYVEARGSQMQNPSAYLTHMIGRVAVEGPTEEPKEDWKKKRPTGNSSGGARTKKVDGGKKSSAPTRNSVKTTSIMSNVDMSNSIPSGESKMSTIFPSMSRGRGRGRGYM